jgi:hypothetical protein
MAIKCEQCDREFEEEHSHEYPGKVYVHKNKVLCEDCLVDMGVSTDEAQPYKTFIDTRTDIPET